MIDLLTNLILGPTLKMFYLLNDRAVRVDIEPMSKQALSGCHGCLQQASGLAELDS
ncbi:MAG: hypothetical protein ACI9WC_001039 [Arenicella sp.]